MNQSVADLYTKLSGHYDDWFSSPWPEPAKKQGRALSAMLQEDGIVPPARVIDLTCGVGTQAIGLALEGYNVTAMDISPGQIEEAKKRAQQAAADDGDDKDDLDINWICGDAADPGQYADGGFDAAISFGNSFPLLGSFDDVKRGLENIRKILYPGGRILISMRDHTDMRETRPYVTCSGSFESGDRKGVWLETAEWLEDGRHYKSHIIFIQTTPGKKETHYPFPPLAAVTRAEFTAFLKETGYKAVDFIPQARQPAFSFSVYSAQNPA